MPHPSSLKPVYDTPPTGLSPADTSGGMPASSRHSRAMAEETDWPAAIPPAATQSSSIGHVGFVRDRRPSHTCVGRSPPSAHTNPFVKHPYAGRPKSGPAARSTTRAGDARRASGQCPVLAESGAPAQPALSVHRASPRHPTTSTPDPRAASRTRGRRQIPRGSPTALQLPEEAHGPAVCHPPESAERWPPRWHPHRWLSHVPEGLAQGLSSCPPRLLRPWPHALQSYRIGGR
eukprot:scaffold270_cov121-Isochrysis_galbana.AAC.4